jgi:cytochrome c oxidase cbb3-type subunit 4
VPYTDADIAGAAAAVEGKTRLDALIATCRASARTSNRGTNLDIEHGPRIDHARAVIAFIALVFWAYSKRRKADFDKLARMPLEDEPPAKDSGSNTHD